MKRVISAFGYLNNQELFENEGFGTIFPTFTRLVNISPIYIIKSGVVLFLFSNYLSSGWVDEPMMRWSLLATQSRIYTNSNILLTRFVDKMSKPVLCN